MGCKLVTTMEIDVLANLEVPGQTILGDFIPNGHRRFDFCGRLVLADHAQRGSLGDLDFRTLGGQCRIPTTCNPRSVDFEQWRELGQDQREYELEVRLSEALLA